MPFPAQAAPFAAVALISAAALAYEILLTRIFAIVHWHHLVATAISLALLGYGASGTFIAVLRPHLERHFAAVFVGNALLFALSSLLCVELAQALPFDPQALTWEPRQLGFLTATFLVLALPFFAAANCVALALSHFREDIPRLYGFDLVGAGLGAFVLLLALAMMPPAHALYGVFAGGVLAAAVGAFTLRWWPWPVSTAGIALAVAVWFFAQPTIHPAPYKDLAQSLAVVGATVETELSGVAGSVTVVRNDQVPIRHAPGLSLQATVLPPQQKAVFVDGDASGTLDDFSAPAASAYLGELTSALPYQLLATPRVAVLNAGVGSAVQQALTLGAVRVLAIEPNPQLHALRCEHYPHGSGDICDPGQVEWQIQAPRSGLARHANALELIVQEVHADSAGLDALKLNFGLTTEAFGAYLAHLAPGGLLAVEGPTRVPPRLTLRLLDTARAALARSGVSEPSAHIAMIRGWRRFSLVVAPEPLSEARIAAVREFASGRGFDLVWLPDIRPDEVNRFQQLTDPQFYNGAAALLGETTDGTAAFTSERFRLRPASDDRPFPHRFTRWSEWLAALSGGDRAQLAQLDTALFVATTTLVLVAAISVPLILLPLLRLRERPAAVAGPALRLRTFTYFAILGIAFLFIEIAWIQRLQLFLGHPVYATTAVLAAFLIFAGLGSMWSQGHSGRHAERSLWGAVGAILLFSLAYIFFLPAWLDRLADAAVALRILVVLLFLAPLAFAMGMPFPLGLKGLGRSAAPLIPWAWGINGCASVISAASVPLLAIEIGFSGLIGVAVAAYLLLPLLRLNRAPLAEAQAGHAATDSAR